MRDLHEHESKVLEAIEAFARTAAASRGEAADISVLAEATGQLPLSNLDYWERFIRWEFRRAIEAARPPRWKFWSRPTPFLNWIELCSSDGYQREKALRSLGAPVPNSFFLALAVRRLNDWVPQVRQAACDQLPAIAAASDPEHIVDVLCIILPNWMSWGRMQESERQLLLQIIATDSVASTLSARLISATAGPMSSILAQAGRCAALDSRLAEIAARAVQPSLRAKAYRCLLEAKMTWFDGRRWEWTDKRYCEGGYRPILGERALEPSRPFMATLAMAATDRSTMVRRVAGELLIRDLSDLGPESRGLAEQLASDPSPSVAERGRFALRRLSATV